MSRFKSVLLPLALAIVTLLSACSSDKFSGKWENVARKSEVIEIKKNGDTYLINLGGSVQSATVQNGQLVLSGPFAVTFTYVQDGDTLLVQVPMDNSVTYKRI